MSDRAASGVAAFDFDGTISQRDTLLGFLLHVGGPLRVAAALGAESPGLLRGVRGDDDERDAAKERVLGRVLRGRHIDELHDAGRSYAQRLPKGFRDATLERVRWHRDSRHSLVMVSASMVYYLRPVADGLGFDHVIGVEMDADATGHVTGELVGRNVRAAEKERRLRSWLAERDLTGAELWAYGDSSGDDHLLAMADHPTWIGKRASRNA